MKKIIPALPIFTAAGQIAPDTAQARIDGVLFTAAGYILEMQKNPALAIVTIGTIILIIIIAYKWYKSEG